MQMSREQQLMMLRNFVDEIELSEVGNEYVLKLTGEGTEFLKSLFKNLVVRGLKTLNQ
ncbi:hypothetical protein KHA80_14815 [Anaerobacillus sp. HL2]|nr:hypothetical protein KHA80_14815 [Anaerobacillus sp. HL2]